MIEIFLTQTQRPRRHQPDIPSTWSLVHQCIKDWWRLLAMHWLSEPETSGSCRYESGQLHQDKQICSLAWVGLKNRSKHWCHKDKFPAAKLADRHSAEASARQHTAAGKFEK